MKKLSKLNKFTELKKYKSELNSDLYRQESSLLKQLKELKDLDLWDLIVPLLSGEDICILKFLFRGATFVKVGSGKLGVYCIIDILPSLKAWGFLNITI